MRRSRALLLPVCGALVAAIACLRGPGPGAAFVVVFVDVSGSVRDTSVFQEAWGKVVDGLAEGDRIALGRISDATYTRFKPMLDREVPLFSPLTDNKMQYDKRVREAREEIRGALGKALAGPSSPKTDIMNSLVLAEKMFAGDPRQGVLVLLSDMLEDSEEFNFERRPVSASLAKQVIQQRKQQGHLPDLRGAMVYVAGASATTASRAQAVQEFWLEYVRAANGRLLAENYGPALVNYTRVKGR